VHAVREELRERAVHEAVAIDTPQAFEALRDDDRLEVRLRALRHAVIVALVQDLEQLGREGRAELVFDESLLDHG